MERLVWARNPDNYIKEAIEAGQTHFVFDRGRMEKRGLDVTAFFDLYMGVLPWECLVLDGGTRTAMHLDNSHSKYNPKAVYPIWEFGEDIQKLSKLMQEPWGEDRSMCSTSALHVEERPVWGQDHIVVIQNLPDARQRVHKQFYRLLAWMQEEFPHCRLHLHGLYSFRMMYGLGFHSTDFDPRNDAGLGWCVLPTGIKRKPDNLGSVHHWTDLFGYKPVELKVPRNRCIFNIKSHRWAAEYYNEAVKIDTNKKREVDPDAIEETTPENKRIFVSNKKAQEGDKFYCDLCSLADTCKFFRQGSVCIVPGSDAVDLAKMFHTRESDSIIDGLGLLMEVQSRRLGTALEQEEDDGKVNPEVTKMINAMFTHGVKLAKLVNPALASPRVAVNLNQNNGIQQITGATPQALVSGVLAEFTRRGIDPADVTPEMIQSLVTVPEEVKNRAIDVATADNANS